MESMDVNNDLFMKHNLLTFVIILYRTIIIIYTYITLIGLRIFGVV